MNIDDKMKLLRQIVRDIADTMAHERTGCDVLASSSFDAVLVGVNKLLDDDDEQKGEI